MELGVSLMCVAVTFTVGGRVGGGVHRASVQVSWLVGNGVMVALPSDGTFGTIETPSFASIYVPLKTSMKPSFS